MPVGGNPESGRLNERKREGDKERRAFTAIIG